MENFYLIGLSYCIVSKNLILFFCFLRHVSEGFVYSINLFNLFFFFSQSQDIRLCEIIISGLSRKNNIAFCVAPFLPEFSQDVFSKMHDKVT